MNITTKEIEMKLREKLGQDIAREALGITLHALLASVLSEKWVGKTLNKRVATQFEAKLKEQTPEELRESVTVYWRNEYGWYELHVWGIVGAKSYDQRICMMIAYHQDSVEFKIETFEKHDNCHGQAAIERQEQRRKLCQEADGGDLTKIADAIRIEKESRKTRESLVEYGLPGDQIKYFADELAKA